MADCGDLLTNQDLSNAKKDATTMNDFVESNQDSIVSKNGKIIRTLEGINNDAQDAIDSFKLKSKGQYLPNPITINDGFEYVVYLDKTYFAVSPPYTTDPITYPTPDLDTVNLIEQSYLTRSFGEKIAGDGDSQLAGGTIWPLSSQEIAQVGDDLTGYSFVRFSGGDFLNITIFPMAKKDGTITPLSGVISNINLTTRPYSATVGSDDVWLLDVRYYDGNSTSIDIKSFWPFGDGMSDDWDQMKAFTDFVSASRKLGIVSEGHYYTDRDGRENGERVELPCFRVYGEGVHYEGRGNPIIELPNDYALYYGTNWMDGIQVDTRTRPLTQTTAKYSNVFNIADTSGYNVGDYVLIYAGLSNSSSGSNSIPLIKQWARIRSISPTSLTLWTGARYDFEVNANPQATARITGPGEQHAINCTVKGVEIRNSTGSTTFYAMLANSTLNCSLEQSMIDTKSASGSTTFSDNFVIKDCIFNSYSGFGNGRGCGKWTMLRCDWSYRFGDYEGGAALFNEESPEFVHIEDCNIIGTGTFAGNSADTTTQKRLVMKNVTIETQDGKAFRVGSLFNELGYAIIAEGCRFVGAGGASNDGLGVKCLIDLRFVDSFKFEACEFSGMDFDAQPIYVGLGTVPSNRYIVRDCFKTNNQDFVDSVDGFEISPVPLTIPMKSQYNTGPIEVYNQQLLVTDDRGADRISPTSQVCSARRLNATSITITNRRETGLLIVSGRVSLDAPKTFTCVYLLHSQASGFVSVDAISELTSDGYPAPTTSIAGGDLIITGTAQADWHISFLGTTIA